MNYNVICVFCEASFVATVDLVLDPHKTFFPTPVIYFLNNITGLIIVYRYKTVLGKIKANNSG